uniref:Sodium/hydrogen exchanger n=1 Tax=Globodera pallida TaxID=36090 RepID=A0A183CFG2_GLOPA
MLMRLRCSPALLLLLTFLFLPRLSSVHSELEPSNAGALNSDDPAAKNLASAEANNSTSSNSSKIPIFGDPQDEQTTQVEEKKDSLAIFFILFVIVLAILLVHLLIKFKLNYLPESLAIVLLGVFIGFALTYSKWDWREVEQFNPNFFFLVLLPPIIFESGYNLHKGNFFANIVPILLLSIVGTAISALVMGFCLYAFGQAGLIYELNAIQSFAFGSMISAVDPLITLAIFQALKVEVQLYMLAFGESMLNDAVAIVLATTAQELSSPDVVAMSSFAMVQYAFLRFLVMFFASAALGALIGLISALLFKHIDLRRTPSLELALLLVFAYLPYGLAESISLSGIMAILFCAIVMSQYTHFSISPITQITFQQTFRTISFVAETCTFAYLGLSLFTIKLVFHPMFLIFSIILLFASRAASVFPLSDLVNRFSKTKISMKNQIIIWFSGMRGAVALALALHMDWGTDENKGVILTSTLFIILFTIIFMGGSALPLIKILTEMFPDEQSSKLVKQRRRARRAARSKTNGIVANGGGSAGALGNGAVPGSSQRRSSPVILSKTQEMVIFDNSEHFTDCEDAANNDVSRSGASGVGGANSGGRRVNTMPDRKNILSALNENFVRPFFVRKFTPQEKLENNKKLRHIAFEAMKHEGGGLGSSSNGIRMGGGGTTSGAAETSSDDEVYFQSSSSTLNVANSEPAQPLLPL